MLCVCGVLCVDVSVGFFTGLSSVYLHTKAVFLIMLKVAQFLIRISLFLLVLFTWVIGKIRSKL